MLKQIKASAGSGKTYTLTRAFLRLLKGARENQSLACRLLRQGPNHSSGNSVADVSASDSSVYSWPDILAVTFTNKAATEMKGRILRTLKEQALGFAVITPKKPEEQIRPELAKAWLRIILSRYAALNIRTIDSLLTQLTRLSALDLHLPPDFQPAFTPKDYFDPVYDALVLRLFQGDQELGELFEEAVEKLLLHSKTRGFILRKPLKERLLSITNWGLSHAYKNHAEQTDYAGESGSGLSTDSEIFPLPDGERLLAHLRQAHNSFKQSAARLLDGLKEKSLSIHANALKALEVAKAHHILSEPKHSTYYEKTDLDELLLKKSKGEASDALYRYYAELSENYTWIKTQGKLYSAALTLLPFVELASPLAREMQALQEEHGKVPMERIYSGAGVALSGASGVSAALCRLGASLTHVLIDEFQDTSRSQWRAISPLAQECLSRGGSLTYVGDVKQAIYGWRGGDAALFEEIPEQVGISRITPSLERSALPCNWRSRRAIVEFNNNFFSALATPETALATARAMLPEETPEELIAESAQAFSEAFAGAAQELPPRNLPNQPDSPGQLGQSGQQSDQLSGQQPGQQPSQQPGLTRLIRLEAANTTELDQQVRERLQATLRELVERRGSEGIAVLTRSNSQAGKVAAWISELGLPVVTSSSYSLQNNPLVQQLVSFLRFLDNPEDELSFWNFIAGQELFSGAVGLETEELFAWLSKTRGHDFTDNSTLAVSSTKGQNTKNPSCRPNLMAAFRRDYPLLWEKHIRPFYARAGFMNAYDCVAETLRCFRVPDRNPESRPYLARFLEFTHSASENGEHGEGGAVSLSDFLKHWDDCGKEARLPAPEDNSAVRVLTIHNSKGLEFPILILPYHNFSDKDDKELIALELDGQSVLAPCIKESAEPWFRSKMRGALETMNVIYVAWTRAVDELHIFLTNTARGDNEKSRAPSIRALDAIFQSVGWEIGLGEILEFGTPMLLEGATRPTPPSPPITELEPKKPQLKESGINIVPMELRQHTIDFTGEATPPLMPKEALPKKTSPKALLPAETPLEWPMSWLPRLKIFRNQLDEFNFTPKRRGLLAHACLEKLRPGKDPFLAAQAAVRLGMSEFPLPLPDQSALEAELTETLSWAAALPEMPHWLRHGVPEQSILDIDGKLHRVDLLVDDGNKLTVVEYKTGQPEEAHRQQASRYLDLLSDCNVTNSRAENSVGSLERELEAVLVYLDERRLERVF